MTTYSFIQYNVLNGAITFKNTPTPDLSETLGVGSLSNKYTRDILQYINSEGESSLSPSSSISIINFLENTPEINLADSKYITLKLEVIDDTEVENVDIVSVSLDGTKTYVTKTGPLIIIDWIKLPKYPTMAKCKDCLKFTFTNEHIFNFTGNVGGYFSGVFNNGQKVYDVFLIDYSSPISYGQSIPYKLYWKPNITYTGLDYNGNAINLVNQNKWIMVPAALSGSAQQIGASTFFHIKSSDNAPCPYTPPTMPPFQLYNFFGRDGFFLCQVSPSAIPNKPCPSFIPFSGSVVWGYNCGSNGCVEGPSGSVTYSTLEQCRDAGCPEDPITDYGFNCVNGNCVTGSAANTGSFNTLNECIENCFYNYGYNCINGECVQGNILNTGSYTTIIECQESGCPLTSSTQLITTCSCNPNLNLLTNSEFNNGIASWGPSYGAGNFWNFGGGNAQLTTNAQFNNDFTSSAYLNQYELLTPTCSYTVCFQAWLGADNPDAMISVNPAAVVGNQPPIGPFPIPNPLVFINLTTTPTAYSASFVAGSTAFGFYLGVTQGSNSTSTFYLDNICLTLDSCPPTASDCVITGSGFNYDNVEYTCVCPVGYIPDLFGNCVPSGSITVPKIITGISINAPIYTYGSWGVNMPALYYNYTNIGVGTNSIGTGTPAIPQNPSPIFGNTNVYHTPYTFDLLKNTFWRGWNANYNLCGLSAQLFRQIPTSGLWVGGGSFIDVPVTKTYYVALIADDIFRFKLDGNVIIENTGGWNLNAQQTHANSATNTFWGINPYLTSNLAANYFGNWTYRSLHIYPITITAGCHYLTLEGKDTNDQLAGFGGLILDNTDIEIANATGDYDLNIIWDSRVDLIYDLTYAITASCPPNTNPAGPDPCDLCITSGSIIPCGECIECFNGTLYNGYVVDAGGYTQLGRGSGGLVNTNALNNPINTWVIPNETDWDTLVTYLNNNTPPSNIIGNLGTIAGGKMKDYVRDLTATCWAFPNVGSQNNSNSSGWTGIASGKRDDTGTFSGIALDGYWWSANSTPTTNITSLATRELKNWSFDVYKNIYPKNHGHSIRLVRPAIAGETNGTIVYNAYEGNDNKLYDGIVIGTQVWISKNLNETKYNNGSNINITSNNTTWGNAAQSPILAASCYYDNNTSSTSSLAGNIDPATGACYEYPTWYVYQKCGGTETLVQEVSGSTTTPGKVQKAPNNDCWTFIEQIDTNPTANYSIYSATNYFSGSNTVYDTCDECTAIHTMYMTFETKNC